VRVLVSNVNQTALELLGAEGHDRDAATRAAARRVARRLAGVDLLGIRSKARATGGHDSHAGSAPLHGTRLGASEQPIRRKRRPVTPPRFVGCRADRRPPGRRASSSGGSACAGVLDREPFGARSSSRGWFTFFETRTRHDLPASVAPRDAIGTGHGGALTPGSERQFPAPRANASSG